ncbi:unnamed protein product [Notodromas monacha]|uniref:Plexin A n=1 Tax=Notodromas monacha TaxID=399045 RepID=A0A7R9BEI7_9CRUS|nr:unnamed protein product [Notodromas monacha]CAG0913869.1 unnamed protein product [Notodromas monacha]
MHLEIDNLPLLGRDYVCAFTAMGKTITTNATRSDKFIKCPTPRNDLLPVLNHGQHFFTAILSLRFSDGQDFVATNFTFFNCNTYASCTSCVSSSFECDWCVDGNRCTHDAAENCRNDILVTGLECACSSGSEGFTLIPANLVKPPPFVCCGLNKLAVAESGGLLEDGRLNEFWLYISVRQGPSIRSGPTFCPRIQYETEEILVASGTTMPIRVKVDNIAQFIVQARFLCQFNIDGRAVMKQGQLLGDTIYCDATRFSYNSHSPNLTATFAVIWGSAKSLDNPKNVHIVIYRCDVMADNCGMCLSLDPKYKCGWCQSSNRCSIDRDCSEPRVWLKESDVCPDPMIVDFNPKYGPWESGTNITIQGINLGRVVEDIEKNIMVAGIPCMPYKETYIQTRQVTCTPDSPGVADPRKGIVIVKVGDFRAESRDTYEFVNPVLYSVRPRRGPKSGGTEISVRGRYMNAGSRITAFVNEFPCNITWSSLDEVRCVTSAADRSIIDGKVRVNFDKGERALSNQTFEYTDDPVVTSVEHGLVGGGQTKSPKGIVAGGITIRVTGRRFDVVQNPQIYVEDDQGRRFYGRCAVETSESMFCQSPTVESDTSIIAPMHMEYGFIMDNVIEVLNLSRRFNASFTLYPNPIFEKFEEKIKYYKSDYLTINGRELDRACTEADVIVRIGTKICNVTSLSRNQLTCRPPDEQPPGFDDYGKPTTGQLPEVVVIVGDNLTYKIGYLSYAPLGAAEETFSMKAIIPTSVIAALFLVGIIAICIMYRRKSTENARVLKNMQDQMDVLELKVAAECKEAFAELQTEITDLTSDLTTGGIPFLDYRTYAMKILFPNIEDHPVLRMDYPEMSRKEKGLRLFGTLVMNKTFLLLFIRTLESNRYFSMRDRVNVASLIMVALQGKMEYCTDTLKTLLGDLIEKCMDGKSHPKLLLRRTESVAEKMLSAWFTFLLYKFLRECAGEPLFLLYRAIKQQVDKGPVDAVTSEARYSLSEEKLIRQAIDFKLMTVFVSMSTQTLCVSGYDAIHDTNDVYVKVLNCDTISQVKEKALDAIYRNTPYTQRPSKDDLDLELRIMPNSRITLFDEDSKTSREGSWKRYNTLGSYNVPDQAYLTLVPKQSSMYNFSAVPGGQFSDTLKSHKYETLTMSKYSGGASPPISRATSPLNSHEYGGMDSSDRGPGAGGGNYRYWHLVRHSDQDHHQNGKEGERSNKMITLQKYVDDLFETIFSIAHRGSALPLAIKYMFDFLDDQALQHCISDSEVVHTWKSNSLPLRFWVNLIKNPNFVFDIHKGNVVDSCLSVVAQTFMDSCSTSDHRLGKDSPSSKLLYAKDIPVYKDWVERYYHDIKTMPAISDQDMNAMLAEESRMHGAEFNTNSALHELYTYAFKYNDQLKFTLEDDEFSKKQRLAHRLQQVHDLMVTDNDM